MATTPTNNPIPSESPRDLKFNAGKIDEVVNSANLTYTDRFGVDRLTIEGLRRVAQDAISAFGYITVDSFEDGATLTLPNQVLRYKATGEYYRWGGSFPKVVPAGSTPASTGGISSTAWLSVGDAALRTQLGNPDTMGSVVAMRIQSAWGKQRTLTDKLSDVINARDIVGVDVTGAADSTAAMQAAFNSMSVTGGCIHVRAQDKLKLSSSLTIPQNCSLIGELGDPEQAKPSLNQSYYDFGNCIRLSSTATITLDRGASIDGFIIINDGLSLPVTNNATATTVKAQFSGTALKAVEPGNKFSNLLVLGFEYAFYGAAVSPVSGRTVFENFHFDCTNGIHKEYSVDIDRFWGVHGWPYLTAHVTGVTDANLARSGTAIYLKNVADWSQLFGCFCYGYNNGFIFEDVWNCQIIGGGADACGSVGIANIGTSRFNRASNFFINSNNTCITINVTGGTNPDFKTFNCVLNGVSYGAYVTAGSYFSHGDSFMGGVGVAFTDGTVSGGISDPYFDGVVTPIVLTAASELVVTRSGFKFSATQPNTTVAEKYFATETIYHDRRPVAVDNGHFFEQGAMLNDGKMHGLWRAGVRLKNATVGSESSNYAFTAYNNATWVDRFVMTADGVFRPVADGVQPLGAASNRWGQIYSASSTISTSDKRAKSQLKKISEAEKATASQIKGMIKSFKFRDAVKEKSADDARIHFGVIAQEVEQAFKDNGLNPESYGMFCYDEWENEYKPVIESRVVEKDQVVVRNVHSQNPDTGAWGFYPEEVTIKVQVEEDFDTGEKVLVKAAGSRYGIRYEELLCFIIASM